MDVLWVLLIFNSFFLSCGEGDSANVDRMSPKEETTQELKLFPPDPKYAGQTRMPRTLLKKLHSGAAFLAGLKLGAVLSKKGFELGHGKIASSHSFQIFGKSVNSAMSLSYGDGASVLPLVDDESGSKTAKRIGSDNGKEDEKVFRVTVIENLSNETMEEPSRKDESSDGNDSKGGDLLLYQDAVEEEPEVEVNFLEEHNKRVKEFNDNIFRRKNSKF